MDVSALVTSAAISASEQVVGSNATATLEAAEGKPAQSGKPGKKRCSRGNGSQNAAAMPKEDGKPVSEHGSREHEEHEVVSAAFVAEPHVMSEIELCQQQWCRARDHVDDWARWRLDAMACVENNPTAATKETFREALASEEQAKLEWGNLGKQLAQAYGRAGQKLPIAWRATEQLLAAARKKKVY